MEEIDGSYRQQAGNLESYLPISLPRIILYLYIMVFQLCSSSMEPSLEAALFNSVVCIMQP